MQCDSRSLFSVSWLVSVLPIFVSLFLKATNSRLGWRLTTRPLASNQSIVSWAHANRTKTSQAVQSTWSLTLLFSWELMHPTWRSPCLTLVKVWHCWDLANLYWVNFDIGRLWWRRSSSSQLDVIVGRSLLGTLLCQQETYSKKEKKAPRHEKRNSSQRKGKNLFSRKSYFFTNVLRTRWTKNWRRKL